MHQCLLQTKRLTQLLAVLIFAFMTRQGFHTLFAVFSDFVVYVLTTLIFPTNRRQCASFSIKVAILFLQFKRAITAPNKSIDSQHHKRHRRKTLIAFPSLSHFTSTTTQANLILKNFTLLQNDLETGTIFFPLSVISFKHDKNIGNFLVRSSLQLMTNLELL